MTDDVVIQQYKDDHGKHCPVCGAPHPRRSLHAAAKTAKEVLGDRCLIFCYCGRCAAEWMEQYVLDGMEILYEPKIALAASGTA